MFPLGTVVVPGMVLPLQVFEPRYREMLQHVLAGDRTFGVVLIERGSEVGGGDVRTDVGTLARVVRAEEQPDGRWAVVALGVGRIRVDRWALDGTGVLGGGHVTRSPDRAPPPVDLRGSAASGCGRGERSRSIAATSHPKQTPWCATKPQGSPS